MHTYMHIPLCRYINTCVYIYICICEILYTIVHATETQATSPTGNRAKGNHSYRQPVCNHWEVPRGPWRIPGGSLEGPCISQCCVFQRFERILRNLQRVPGGSPAKSCWKVPRGAWCKPCSVVQIIAGTSVSAPGEDAQTPAIYEYTNTYKYTHIYIYTFARNPWSSGR